MLIREEEIIYDENSIPLWYSKEKLINLLKIHSKILSKSKFKIELLSRGMNESTFLIIRDNFEWFLQLDIYSESYNFDRSYFDFQKVEELIETNLLSFYASHTLNLPEIPSEFIIFHKDNKLNALLHLHDPIE